MKRAPAALLAASIAASQCEAAEIKFFHFNDGTGDGYIRLEGNIEQGDSSKIEDVLTRATAAHMRPIALRLNSQGGSVLESNMIAAGIRGLGITTMVPEDGVCASACFTIFAAGISKLAAGNAKIGVHNASNGITGGQTWDAMAVTVVIAQALKQYGVPASVIGNVLATQPGEIYWLTNADLLAMNVSIVPAAQPAYNNPSPSVAPNSYSASSWMKMICYPADSSPYVVRYYGESGRIDITGAAHGITRHYPIIERQDRTEKHVLYVSARRDDQDRTLYFAFDYSQLGKDVSDVRVKGRDGNGQYQDKTDKCSYQGNAR